MTYHIVNLILVFFKKFAGARKGNLVYVFIHLFCSHTNAPVRYGQGMFVFVCAYADGQIAQILLEIALSSQCLNFLSGIHCIRYQFSEKYLVI